ncbi:MAG: sulfurtransferase TusA family protein [Candidatus Hydrothermarchaeaceae archaeon]
MKYELNVKGKVCPMPLLETKRKLKELKAGDVLEILTDYEPATRTISLLAKKCGYGVEIENTAYVIRIEVK